MIPGSYRPPAASRYKPLGPRKAAVGASMRKMADDMKDRHPDLGAHLHIRDAADALARGEHDAAQRHLRAAIGNMEPQSLRRHGLLTDSQHDAAKRSMDAIHRHLLLVKDIQETHEQNMQLPRAVDEARAQHADNDLDDPNDKPTARQPGGGKAMNAPYTTPVGRIDINVTKPQQMTNPKAAHQIAAANSGDLTVDLAFNPGELRDDRGEWRFGGSPGTAEHASFLRGFADRLDSGGKTGAGDETRAAADAIDRHDLNSAGEHLDRAYMQRRSDTGTARQSGGTIAARRPAAEADELDRNSRMLSGVMMSGQPDVVYDLAFNPGQPRDHIGRWSATGHGGHDNTTPGDTNPNRVISQEAGAFRWGGDEQFAGDMTGHMSQHHPLIEKTASAHIMDHVSAPGSHGHSHPFMAKLGNIAHQAAMLSPEREDMSVISQFSNVELSAETSRLAVTPAPRGRPGGPGLYDVKGNEHSAYLQQVVKALIEKRGMKPGAAYAIARASIRRWGAKSKHPEVRAAATGAEAQEIAAQARAHAHANEIADAIQLTGTAAGAAKDPRIQAGQAGGGRFGSGGGQQKPQTAHQKHVAHVAHMKTAAGRRQQIAADRKQIASLQRQRAQLLKSIASAMKSASGKTTKGQAGAVTKATATTKTSAPAAAKTAASTAKTAAAKARAAAAKPTSLSGMRAQLAKVNSQIAALQKQIKQLGG